MAKRIYKNYVPSPENRAKIIIGLHKLELNGSLDSRNKAIIQDVLLGEIASDAAAERYALSLRSIQLIVSGFLRQAGVDKQIKPQSMGAHRRLGVDKDGTYNAYNNSCALCGFSVDGLNGGGNVIHHIKHIVDGGTNKPSNLILLCPNCHMLAHANRITAHKLRKAVKGR